MITFEKHPAGYDVTFPYEAEIVELIKAEVHPSKRKWEPARKAWAVDAGVAATLAEILIKAGYAVVGLKVQRELADDWATRLFAAVGPVREDAVYRALAKILHPDLATGSTVLQRQLNDARTRPIPHRRAAS